ncbi:hypothetical protein [Brevundimonas sp.]|uniref:hypothetical protein n=1 Tax=Brevundimonas sp. TaxID=1871086 RepID=UPI002D6992F7|nr:hypothetical protein [Brevundimonas sp.]HYC68898.1 hypothetical protein [Brevundimonas sp.]
MTAATACDGEPNGSQAAAADTALRMLETGDGRACAAPATTQTVLQLARQAFRPYRWSEGETRAYLDAVGLEAVEITVAETDTSAPWMECEATLRASEGPQSWEQRIGYRLAKQVDDASLRVELHDARSTSALLNRASESYVRDVITPARQQNADAAAAPLCATFRQYRQTLSFQEISDLKHELHQAAERQNLVGLGPLGSTCLSEMETELRAPRHRGEASKDNRVAPAGPQAITAPQQGPSAPAKANRIASTMPPGTTGQDHD